MAVEPRSEAGLQASGLPVGASTSFALRWRSYARRLAVTDLVAILVAEATAILVRIPWYSPNDTLEWSIRSILITIGLAVGWMASLAVLRTRDRKIVGVGATEYSRVALATWWTFAILAIVSYTFKLSLTRSYVAIALPVGLVLLLVGRWLWRGYLTSQRARGEALASVLVVGHQDNVRDLIRILERRPSVGYAVVGACVPPGESPVRGDICGVPVVGTFGTVTEAASTLAVDVVAVTGSDAMTSDFVRRLGWALAPNKIDLLVAGSLTDVAGPRLTVTPVEGTPLMHVDAPRFSGPKYAIKLILDLLGAAVLTVLVTPVAAVIALVIRVSSPGPVIYRQRRVGRDGAPFVMYKFRTMDVGADSRLTALAERNEGNGLLFKMRNDPRVFPVGRFLRRFSLDELPQLINVLRLEMSLVGPRPPLESEVEQYDSVISRRLLVKPGMTGLWQVSGRSDLPLDESIRYDLYYVDNWSVMGDLMIVWRTLRAVVGGSGAY